MIAETTTDNEDSIQAVTELLSTISEKLSAEESSTETELEALKEAAKPAFVMTIDGNGTVKCDPCLKLGVR